MITILLLRNGECHINSYRLTNGNYRTICSKTVEKNSQANTLAADDTFPGTCSICKRYYDEMYRSDLDYAAAMARNESTNNLRSTLEYNRSGIIGPESDYMGMETREWWRLNKYQRLIPKAKPKGKKFRSKYRLK